jgi:membrane protease YdiL (CAAX protease family)
MSHTRTLAPSWDNPELRPLLIFGSIAVPVGWVLLTAYQVLDLPQAPFVLLTLLVGLVLPAVLLVRRDPTTSGRQLWRDCYRPARPVLLVIPAAIAIPGLTALAARSAGVDEPVTSDVLTGMAINVVSSMIIVNLWEEMAWTGFFQRRAMSRWGMFSGSVVTAVLFAAVHLPLAFDGADGAGEVIVNVGYLLLAGVGLRLLIAGFDVWSHRSLLTIALLHASFNAAAEVVEPAHDVIRYAVTLALGLLVLFTPARRAYSQARQSSPRQPDRELTHDH